MPIEIKSFAVGYLRTNCYVVTDGKACIIVDPGGGFDKVKQYLTDNKLSADAVLLTHGHFDHILALRDWQKAGAKVYVHELDEKMLHNEWNLAPEIGLGALPDVKPDVILYGDEDLTFGSMNFHVIHTPGHTQGGVCYDLNKEYLFSGDTLLAGSFGRTDFYGGSLTELVASFQKIFALEGDRIVYPGHGESTTLFWEKDANPINSML